LRNARTAIGAEFPDWAPAAVRERCSVRELAAGESLFRQGDKTFALFEVAQGLIRLFRQTVNNDPAILHVAKPGQLFAEAALFSDVYHCDAVATSRSIVRAYPKSELLQAFRQDPALAEQFMAVLARQIQQLRARLEERTIRSARERLLHHLRLALGKDGRTVLLEGWVLDLAAQLGLSHEAVYRTLARLEKDGVLSRSRGSITLHISV
jgi:CRP/FNR family transcriptional regulator, dissimilatory nitrate respiration regulator